MKKRIKELAASLILSGLSLAGGPAFAAEFEVLDRLSVDGYSVFRGSADIAGGSFAVGGSTFVVKDGNVGIGTTAPLNPLHIAADASTDNGQLLLSGATNTLKRLRLGYNTTGNYGVVQALTFGSNYDPLALNPAGGNVGIGITAPGEKLEVSGAIKFTDTSSACDASRRGTMKYVAGGTGVSDYLSQCMKNANENYVWVKVKSAGVYADGGTVTESGGYRIHTFTSGGTFTVTTGGTVEVLVVGGGGGGGGNPTAGAGMGGGGAGGLIYNSGYVIAPGAMSVTVGDGGAGGTSTGYNLGSNGNNSVFGTLTAVGGGRGGGYNAQAGGNGGSGGGGGCGASVGAPGSGTSGQGNPGGAALTGSPWRSGGGGGAGEAGTAATAGTGGKGGNGLSYSISGTSVFYAGGGGGSSYNSGVGLGGSGGGGNGVLGDGQNATSNTGGGGGGGGTTGGNSGKGGNGGSGIVIIRYPN